MQSIIIHDWQVVMSIFREDSEGHQSIPYHSNENERKEITKVIIASSFSVTFPLKLNQNTDNIIPFTSEIPISGEKIYIGFSSLSRAPITKDANWYPHTESSIYGKIVDNTILLTPEDIKNFLPWPMKISLSNIIKQTDGTYSVQSIGNIELVKE
jgi:hypothetical protein